MASALRLGLPRPTAATILHPQPTHLAAALTSIATPPTTHHLFSTTSPLPRQQTYPRQGRPRDDTRLPIPKPHARDEHIPVYPYGPRKHYQQSNMGLYGSARIQFGHNVAPKHNVRTPRKWRPNLMRKRLWSPALRCYVQTRLTVRVLRTVDKVGGLDEYLLGEKRARLKDLGPWGWKLRWRVMQSGVTRERFRAERERLGLGARTEEEEEAMIEGVIEKEMGLAGERSEVKAEMDRKIHAEEDIVLGEEDGVDGDGFSEREGPNDEGFMKEERP